MFAKGVNLARAVPLNFNIHQLLVNKKILTSWVWEGPEILHVY